MNRLRMKEEISEERIMFRHITVIGINRLRMKEEISEINCMFRHNRVIGKNRLRMKEEVSEKNCMFRHIRVIDCVWRKRSMKKKKERKKSSITLELSAWTDCGTDVCSPVPKKPYGFCGRKATWKKNMWVELHEGKGSVTGINRVKKKLFYHNTATGMRRRRKEKKGKEKGRRRSHPNSWIMLCRMRVTDSN